MFQNEIKKSCRRTEYLLLPPADQLQGNTYGIFISLAAAHESFQRPHGNLYFSTELQTLSKNFGRFLLTNNKSVGMMTWR